MRISTRTLIEITAASAAVVLIADAYLANSHCREALVKATNLVKYYGDMLDRHDVPMTEFDRTAVYTIINN